MLLMVLVFTFPGTLTAQSPSKTEAIVAQFYKWYIHEVNSDREPISNDRPTLAKYVTKPLIQKLDRLIRANELDADYFLSAQDVPLDWEANIDIKTVKVTSGSVILDVTLGKEAANIRHLEVEMVVDHEAWKISMVKRKGLK